MADSPVSLPVSGHAELRLSTTSGRITVIAEDRDDVLIESGAPSDDRIDVDATGRITLSSARGGSARLEVRCPVGTDAVVGSVSGSVHLSGQFGAVRVNSASGKIEVDRVEALDARSVSGSIEVGLCAGSCRLQTKSGRTTLGAAAKADASTISGRVTLDNVSGAVRVQTASGRVEIGCEGKGDVAVRTMSGAVKVELPPGVRPYTELRSMTGRHRCDCEEGDDCRINVRSMTGRIEVVSS